MAIQLINLLEILLKKQQMVLVDIGRLLKLMELRKQIQRQLLFQTQQFTKQELQLQVQLDLTEN